GPHHAGGDLWTDGDMAAALVIEVIHLLADDVGGVAHALEDLDVLDQGGEDESVAGPVGMLGEGGHEGRPARRLRREHIPHPLRSRDLGHVGPGYRGPPCQLVGKSGSSLARGCPATPCCCCRAVTGRGSWRRSPASSRRSAGTSWKPSSTPIRRTACS